MKVLELSLVGSCPMDCTFCAQSLLKAAYHGPKLMARETLAAALVNAGKVDQISFAGFAEPYLHPACTELIKLAAMVAPVVIYTTCVGMSVPDVWALQSLRPEAVTVHLADSAGNMKITVTSAYMETLRTLLDSSLDVRLMAMGNVHPMLSLMIGNRKPGGLESMQSRAGNVAGFVKMQHRGPLKCRPAPELDHPVMLPSGEIVACCQDYSLRHVLGNLATTPWDEIYAGEPFKALRAAMASRDGACLCRGCEYAEAV